MNDTPDTNAGASEENAEFKAIQERARGSNVNEQTLLATDYLNHFNEIVMTLEMLADMPELMEEAREWKPKDYKDHFRDSTIADRDLAIEAYDLAPARYRQPFEMTISTINQLISMSLDRADAVMAEGDTEHLRARMVESSRSIQKLMDMASANIHGSEKTLDQSEIDDLIGD